jgi:hypothetical protein
MFIEIVLTIVCIAGFGMVTNFLWMKGKYYDSENKPVSAKYRVRFPCKIPYVPPHLGSTTPISVFAFPPKVEAKHISNHLGDIQAKYEVIASNPSFQDALS